MISEHDLYANAMRYTCVIPMWYRSDGFMRAAALRAFITHCESVRGETHEDSEATWLRVSNSAKILATLRRYNRSHESEADLVGWFTNLVKALSSTYEVHGDCERSASTTSGIGGVLAYTDPGTQARDEEAAYLSRLDLLFFRGPNRTPFAGIEFKRIGASAAKIWYKVSSALAQILCALAGHPECSVALFLCDMGFTMLWRVLRSANPLVYDYYMYPPRDEKDHATFRYCHSAGDEAAGNPGSRAGLSFCV